MNARRLNKDRSIKRVCLIMYAMCVDNLIQLVADVFVDNGINNGEVLYVSAALLWACG
jgi:hypothetical protein